MYRLLVDKGVLQEMSDPKRYPAKIYRQIALKIFALQLNPRPQDCKPVGDGYRVDTGEYRILYKIDGQKQEVRVYLVGKRGNDEVYRRMTRKQS